MAQFCQIFETAVYVDGQPFVIEPNLSRSDTLSESWQLRNQVRKVDRRKAKAPSERQEQVVKARAEGKTYKESGIVAGYPPKMQPCLSSDERTGRTCRRSPGQRWTQCQ